MKRNIDTAVNAVGVAVAIGLAVLIWIMPRPAAGAVDWQKVIANATSNIVYQLQKVATRTNEVDALASPENYALLKSTKLTDAAKKLALQKKLAEAALADADAVEKTRLKWHGAYARQEIDWENLTATFYHGDGYAVTVKFSKPNVTEEVKAANAVRLKSPVVTNGVPARLAAARLRRRAEEEQTSVTVNIEANKVERPNL